MSGPDLYRPRQQTSFKIFVLFLFLCLFNVVCFSLCSWVRVVAHSRDLRKNKKNKRNNTIKPCLGQTCAGRGSRPRSKSVVFFAFVPESVWWHTHAIWGRKKKTKHWNHVWARPVPAEAADLFQNRWFVLCCCFCFVFFVFPFVPEPVWWHTHDIWRKIKNQTKQKQQPS